MVTVTQSASKLMSSTCKQWRKSLRRQHLLRLLNPEVLPLYHAPVTTKRDFVCPGVLSAE